MYKHAFSFLCKFEILKLVRESNMYGTYTQLSIVILIYLNIVKWFSVKGGQLHWQ